MDYRVLKFLDCENPNYSPYDLLILEHFIDIQNFSSLVHYGLISYTFGRKKKSVLYSFFKRDLLYQALHESERLQRASQLSGPF